MPVPVYLICSESGATDENTKLTSFFNLVEKLRVMRMEAQPGQVIRANLTPLRLSAYWMREETDADDTRFEVQFVGMFPNGPPEIELTRGEFQFVGPFARLNVVGLQFNQFFGPGILRIEARIRRIGEETWLNRMSYPIVLEEFQPGLSGEAAAPPHPPTPPISSPDA